MREVARGIGSIGGQTQGKISIINNIKDIRSVDVGNIAVIKRSAFKGDSLFPVYRSIMQGAGGVIIEEGGSLDHGSIAARELEIPCITIRSELPKLSLNGAIYTIRGNSLYKGSLPQRKPRKKKLPPKLLTKHKVKINLGFPLTIQKKPQLAEYSDGVAFSRLEFCLLDVLEERHPMRYLKEFSSDEMARRLADNLEPIPRSFGAKPVWFRTDDFSADQLLQMVDGEKYEIPESNSTLGWRGIRRSIQRPETVIPQFKALKILIDRGYKNLGVFPPMTIRIDEYKKWKQIAKECGLRKDNIQFGLMVETPAAALTIEDFLDEISFVIFGTNDLTQFTLALDRGNPRLVSLFNEKSSPVLKLLEFVIKKCKGQRVETSVGGQAGSNTEFVAQMLSFGISGTSVNPTLTTINQIRKFIQSYEDVT